MVKNYLKIAFRNLRRHALTSFINLSGLAIGLTCCLLILTYVLNELSYDRYNRNADRIYRVTRIFNASNGSVFLHLGTVAPPFGPLLQNDFSDIQAFTRVYGTNAAIRYGEKKFNELNISFADENLAKIFDMPMVQGDASAGLKDPWSIMLSEDEAKKYFGSEDPMGKTLRMDNQYDFKVTGVFKAFPENAHMHPAILASFNTLKDPKVYGDSALMTNWGNNSFFTYLLLPPHYPVDRLTAAFPAFLDRHMGDGSHKTTSLVLQKLTDIHLRSHLDLEAEENGDINKVYIFAAIALFILLIACINYMNLSTARSSLRAREIGIRKTIGAKRGELMAQFLTESVLITYVAMLLALVFTQLTLPVMGRLADRTLTMHVLQPWTVSVPLVLLPLAVGLLSGLYPALFLSAFRPVKVLKGFFKAGASDLSLRKVLVVLQFSISIALIICTAVVFQQIRFINGKSLGYDKSYQVILPYTNELDKTFEAFRTQMLDDPGIKSLTRSSRIPTGRLLDEQTLKVSDNGKEMPVNADVKYVLADMDFISSYGIPMKAGRDFSREYPSDSVGFIINETAARALGWKSMSDAVGKNIVYGDRRGRIVGVMGDFNFESLHQQISPMVITPLGTGIAGSYGYISVRVNGKDLPAALAHIADTWKRFLPQTPYDYNFLDDNFNTLYKAETRQVGIFSLFAGIAIFIACLGLLGLSAFTISQRIKEIGIRKVLGAGTGSIVRLVSIDFLKLVLVAAVVAFPVAWFAMHQWLEGFAYRVPMNAWVFALAALVALLVAFVTISVQTIKAAVANPVKSLRTE